MKIKKDLNFILLLISKKVKKKYYYKILIVFFINVLLSCEVYFKVDIYIWGRFVKYIFGYNMVFKVR